MLLETVNGRWCNPLQANVSNVILNDVIFKVMLCLFENGIAFNQNLGSLKFMYYVHALSTLIKLSFVLSC